MHPAATDIATKQAVRSRSRARNFPRAGKKRPLRENPPNETPCGRLITPLPLTTANYTKFHTSTSNDT